MTMKKVRHTREGDPDPFGGFRDDVEAEMLRLLVEALRAQRRRLYEALGDKPEREPDEVFWQREREALMATLRGPLTQAVQLSVAAHGVSGKSMPDAPLLIAGLLFPDSIPIVWDEAAIALEAVEWARLYVGQLIDNIMENTRTLVRRSVSSFIETPGMTIGDLRRTLEPAFGEVRAQRIAVTETTRAFAEGQKLVRDQLQRGGLRLERVWRTSMDERVCPICGAVADKRESDGWDGLSGPPAHVNCRCWTVLDL